MSRSMLAVLFVLGCGGQSQPGAEVVDDCDVDITNLEGRTFVMYEAMPDKTYRENVMARVKFLPDNKAKYTVKHPFRVWDYDCKLVEGEEEGDDDELRCFEPERAEDWCAALQAHEWGSCTSKRLKQLGAVGEIDDLKKDVVEAKKEARKIKNDPEGEKRFERWKLINNNLGNHLQNRLYIKRDKRDCRLSITDMYFTIFNGRGKEDTNPVGINPFVETSEAYTFEHCEGVLNLAPFDKAEPPENVDGFGNTRLPRKPDTDIYYHYIGSDSVKPEDGCTYTFDTMSQYKPLESGVQVKTDDKGRLQWIGKTNYPADDLVRQDLLEIGLFHMVRYKECEGKKEKIDTLCSANIIK